MTNFYQARPRVADRRSAQRAVVFPQQIIRVMGCIALFFLIYILLLLMVTALATACIVGGIMLPAIPGIRLPLILTVAVGLGIIMLGVMLWIFLIKFLFSRPGPSDPCRTLLQPSEHPRLFAFIEQLAAATHTRLPRKVFAVPHVNAAVLYHSSILSLFWPAGKSLEIGLGLVNSLNLSEFRMVLAHEFGHFSQRSMKLGCYVYVLNKMIYNMLYENERWNTVIVKWAGIGSVFNLFAHFTLLIARGIQRILRRLYQLINREYMSLSREMELHADAVAVGIAGSRNAISGIRRIEMGSFCFEHCLHKLPQLAERKLRFHNLFPAHHALIRYYAAQNRVRLDATLLPEITDEYLQTFTQSRIQLRSPWASHPTHEEREARFKSAGIIGETVPVSAWTLFNNPEQLQETMTTRIYSREAPEAMEYGCCTMQHFTAELEQQQRLYEFPAAFNEYYDNRPFITLTPACRKPLPAAEEAACSPGALYARENVIRIKHYFRDRQDLETLQSIAAGELLTRYFEFDGQSYPASRAPQLVNALQAAIAREEAWLATHSRLAFRFHYTRALHKGEAAALALMQLYEAVLYHQEKGQLLTEQAGRIIHSISTVFGTTGITLEQALPYFDALQLESDRFQGLLQKLWHHPVLAHTWEPALQHKAEHFLQNRYRYLADNTPQIKEIELLHEISAAVMEHYNSCISLMKKEYLEYALSFEM